MPESNDAPQPDAAQQQTEAPAKTSLEDLLGSLDETARKAILGEVSKARTEAATYRTKLREAEPKVAEYEKTVEASKTEAQRTQEALAALQAQRDKATEQLARFEVAAEKNLPTSLVPLLHGSREEMAAAADLLMQQIGDTGRPRPPAPVPTQGRATGEVTQSTNDWLREQLSGSR